MDGNFSFLYTRESDVIGSKIVKLVSEKPKLLTKTEFLKKKREDFLRESGNAEFFSSSQNEPLLKTNAAEIIKAYRHNPRSEDPRYTTSSVNKKLFTPKQFPSNIHFSFLIHKGDYGRKAPSIATLVTDRFAIPQEFSASFNGQKPQNSSMNTALSRSNVHSSLDPQFV